MLQLLRVFYRYRLLKVYGMRNANNTRTDEFVIYDLGNGFLVAPQGAVVNHPVPLRRNLAVQGGVGVNGVAVIEDDFEGRDVFLHSIIDHRL